ncbi:Mitochondrial fission protein [Podila clonocystis]|nr:Mitochondrial fission protein [Podila clonocystis]
MSTAFAVPTRPAPFASSIPSGDRTMLSSNDASRRNGTQATSGTSSTTSTPSTSIFASSHAFSQTISGISATGRSISSMVSSGLQQPRHRIMELLHAFDVSEFASSARNTLSTTSSIVFSPLTAQAVKGDLTGIASLTGLSGLAPHLMATHYLKRATANAQALALTGARPATPLPADQLLSEDIPEPVARVSLFQGFKASYPGHSKNGKRGKNHHRRRKNGFGEVDEDDPNKAFSSMLSERERTIKEQVKLQTQKALLQSELGQVAASIETLVARQTNLGYKLSKLSEREDDLADTLEDLNEKLASISEGTKTKDGEPLQLGYREETRDSGTCMHTFYGHDGIVTCLDLNGPYGTLVTASKDNTTRVWDLSTFKCLGQLPGHEDYVECMQLTQNTLITGSRDNTIRTWNLTDINHAQSSRPSSPSLSDSSNSSNKANGKSPEGEDYSRASIDTLDTLDNCWTSTLSGHTGHVTCLYFEDQKLLSGSNDKTIKEWDLTTGQCVLTMDLLWAMSTSNSWSDWMDLSLEENKYVGSLQFWQYALCSGTIDGAIRMWDLRTGTSHRTLVGHTGPVTSLQFDEYHVVSGSMDRSVRIWDLRTGGIQEILQYEDPVRSLRFDTSKIIVGAGDSLKIYDRVAQQHSYYTGHTNTVESVRFSDSVLASGGQDSTDTTHQGQRPTSRIHPFNIPCHPPSFAPSSSYNKPQESMYPEKADKRPVENGASPGPGSPASHAFNIRSPSTSSHSSRPSLLTRLRYRQLVQPITPTELELIPGEEPPSDDDDLKKSSSRRYPRVELSSLDLAKPRIYTRILYFFESGQTAQERPSSPLAHDPRNERTKSPAPPSSPSSPTQRRTRTSKSKHHYHYTQSHFMDPMLLQASLALVLTDFFPLAGRLLANHAHPGKPFIECNDRGVLFAVADTTTTMQQIREGDFQDTVLPPQLHPVGLYPASLRDPPLLGIQLTYTQDSSLIMGVAMDSSVMDGVSLVSFMDAWSNITQGQDFSPYPILDRTFLKQYSLDAIPATSPPVPVAAIYRHQRINDSPPPPILFDNSLDNLDVLGDSDLLTEDDEDDEDDHSQTSESDERGQESTIPRVTIGHEGELEDAPTDLPEVMEPEGGSLHLFHFSGAQLDRIKKLASEQNIAAAACAADDKEISDKWVSTGDSLIAYLWKMTTITRRMEPDCKLMCGVVMDIRNRLVPPIPEGFIGNAIISIFVQMPVHSLLTTPLSLPSRLLRDELQVQTPEQIRSAMTWIQRQEHPHLIETSSNNPFGLDFMVWSFRKLDMYSPNFGQGAPCKVRIGRGGFGGGEGMCIIMDGASSSSSSSPSRGDSGVGTSASAMTEDGGVDVYLGIQGDHLLDFEKVHTEFMEGLLEPGGEDWQVL